MGPPDDPSSGASVATDACPNPRARVRSSGATWLAVAGLCLVGAALAWWSMPNSAVPANDSWFYVGVAENLTGPGGPSLSSPFAHELTGLSPSAAAAGIGRQPITAWPPLYPILLAAGSPLSVSIETMARLLNVVALAAVTGLTGVLVLRLGGSRVAAALAGLLVACGLATVFVFALAASEPAYLAFQVGALLVAAALGRRITPGRVVAFVALAAAAALTRYVGLAVVGTGVVLVATSSAPLTRLRRVGWSAAAAAAGLPAALWWLHARGEAGFRSGPVFEDRTGDLAQTVRAMGEWFVPADVLRGWRVGAAVALGVALVAAVAFAFARRDAALEVGDVAAPRDATPDVRPDARSDARPDARPDAVDADRLAADLEPAGGSPRGPTAAGAGAAGPSRPSTDRRLVLAIVVHAVLYEVVLLGSASFLDHMIPLGARLTLPLAPSLLALAFAGVDRLVRGIRARPARLAAGALACVVAVMLVGVQLRDTHDRILSKAPDGLWSALDVPPAVAELTGLPPGALVFTNQPSALYAYTRRPVLALPLQRSPMTGAPNPAFDDEVAELVELLRDRGAVVVIDRSSAFFTEGIITSEADLAARLDLEVVAEDPTFVVLRAAGSPAPPAGD